MRSCALRSFSSLCMARAVYFVPFPCGSSMMIAVKAGTSKVGLDGRKPGASATVQTSLRFATISRKQPMLVMSLPSGERITVRKMPPGRRSISQSTVFHGAGVNHFLTCSGTVHAAHTSSGATSTTRSRTRSSRGSCWTVAVTSCPPSAAADTCREAALPQRALLRHPALCRFERLRHEPIGAHAAGLARADEAALFEHVEMLRERWERHVEGARQLAHGGGAGAEPAQHGAPRGIAQRAKDPVEVWLLVRHMPNHSEKPILRSMPKRMARAEDERRLAKPCDDSRASATTLWLWPRMAQLTLGTKYVAVEACNPPAPTRSNIEVIDSSLDVRRDVVPIKLRIFVNDVRRRLIAELLVQTDLLKFVVERIRFSQIVRVAKLTDEICGS